MEGFSFVTPLTGLSKPNTGKEDVDVDEEEEKDGNLLEIY
jgi:hypothetical protein